MRNVAKVLVLLIAICPSITVASSMWCEAPNISATQWAVDAIERGQTVFLGRVNSVTQSPVPEPPDTDGSAASMKDLLELIEHGQDPNIYDHVVSFEIVRSWKDSILPIARMKVRLGGLAEMRKFEVGDVYLIVGTDLENSVYWIRNRCVDAIHDKLASKFVVALDAIYNVK
jgi:hypothetical protein